MRPIPQPHNQSASNGAEEDKTNASDMSISSSVQNNSSLAGGNNASSVTNGARTPDQQQNQSSSILNIPADALSNFSSVQPQRAQQQQMMQQYRSNLNASSI